MHNSKCQMWQSGFFGTAMLAPKVFEMGHVLSKAVRFVVPKLPRSPMPRVMPHLKRSRGFFFGGLSGHCKTAPKAAVAVLRGNGGTFPSQAHKSDPRGVQERAEGTHSKRVILQGQQCVKLTPYLCPKSSELSITAIPKLLN